MKSYFNILEYCITGEMPPADVAAKIQRHIDIMNPIRAAMGFPVSVSKNSGYRPRWYERSKNRSGNGEHNFETEGAADYTTATKARTLLLVDALKKSPYKRICYYPNNNFVHCDFKGSERVYFEADSPTSPWVRKEVLR
jgi:hypothetical protein